MAEIVRKAPRVLAIVGELVAGRVAEHVRVDREGELCGFAGSLNHPQEPSSGYWRTGLSDKYIRACAL
jgi:hypothetical protein